MHKKDIVKQIAEECGIRQVKVKKIVQRTLDCVVEVLVRDGRIELRNFGIFEVATQKARPARNPRTGEKIHVPEKRKVRFKPGKEMSDRVRLAPSTPGASA